MYLIQVLLYLFLLLGPSVLGAPSQPSRLRKRTFKVDLIRRGDYVPNGLAAIKKAYSKYGIIPSDIDFGALDVNEFATSVDRQAVNKAKEPDENGAVTNIPTQNDVQYLSPVTIGGQKFVMNFDTGSSDTWVFNTQLDSSISEGHSVFDPSRSRTFELLQSTTFNITYGDSSFARGNVGMDTIDIGGATVQKQAFGLPNEISDSFIRDEGSDGLVGLAFTTINTMRPEPQTTFFENIASDLQEPVFTAQLKSQAPGSYEFGIVDPAKFVGDMVDIPVDNSRGHWEIKSSMFMVGDDTSVRTVSRGVRTAIADTGTSLMLVNGEIVEAYYSKVPGAQLSAAAGGFIFPCGTELPDLLVSIGDTHLARIPGSLITFSSTGHDSNGNELCFGGIQSNKGARLQIWGDVFFKAIFVAFDLRGPKLRMAAHA
ncbi:endothiapepsin [Paracoccidioides lutzii Pb01]|uniref:Endothiapepsin n=1 Tax=Paracoccidioides lutzii (strain ATCC MYA-826 / Pb01) TaxID=502779 RepID=C1GZJ9_PARBA|nr:endothiapepsin [Paracoccidioides lutzii Pb01]EEH42022.1 endothiapepsin [Paracoccidioides lutzii Pb01]